MITTLWISLFLIFYSFLGYGILLFFLVRLSKPFRKEKASDTEYEWPTLTVIVSAYNEESCIEEKIANTLSLNYPKDKISYIFVSDGSTEHTADIIAAHPQITAMHQPEQQRKNTAKERAMQQVTSDVAVFTDAN